MSLAVAHRGEAALIRFNGTNNPKKPVGQPKQGELKPLNWVFDRPQSSDVITHSRGYSTKATSLIDGGQIFTRIDHLLNTAKDSVLVDMYEIQNPVVNPARTSPQGTPGALQQSRIADKLIELAKKGVKVKVILDNSFDDRENDFHNNKMIEYLRSNGVETLTYPRDKAKISHVKLLIVDNKFAVIGGMNWGNHSAVNHDACVLLEGDDVGNLVDQVFKVDYEFSGGDVSTLPQYKTIPEERIKVLTTSPESSPDGGQNEIYDAIVDRIDNAKHSILAELFVLTDKTVAKKLLAAHKRMIANHQPGVKIIVDPGLYFKFKNCRPMVDFLVKNQVPVKFLKVDWEKEEKLHAKWAVFDEEHLLIGSANWSKVGLQPPQQNKPGYSSQQQFLTGNHEANVLIQSKNLCQAYIKQFFYNWYKKSTPMWGGSGIYKDLPQSVREKWFGRKQVPRPVAPKVVPMPAFRGGRHDVETSPWFRGTGLCNA